MGIGQFPGTSSAATVSESQLTSGLIQLQVYGVASLYEKYVPPGEAPKDPVIDPKPVADPKPKVADPKTKVDPKAKDPAEKEAPVPDPKTPKEPAAPDPKTPKSRRRIR